MSNDSEFDPVAWKITTKEGCVAFRTDKYNAISWHRMHGGSEIIPLYAAPPPVPTPSMAVLTDAFGDVETLLNSRDWLDKALEAAGAKIVGGGIGGCQADTDIVLEGCKFNVSIRPIK